MTTIHFERTGGLLGEAIKLDLDLNKMPDDESQVLQRMIQNADFFKIPENLEGRPTMDGFRYRITVRAGQSAHTVRTSDGTMPGGLQPLVGELLAIHAAHEHASASSAR